MLLGGIVEQPKKLYETAIDVIIKYVFYRPMTEGNRDILLSGNAGVNDNKDVNTDSDGQHLACFAGGMVGIGSRIFNRPNDLAIARKLVSGCTWAYESMVSGLMPEKFHMVACEDASGCEWDEKKWYGDVLQRNKDDGEDVSSTNYDRAKEMVKDRGLVPGMSEISDRRYILR
jgi:mannosyl-oligosaccharide alpha-1,2-mannosidase